MNTSLGGYDGSGWAGGVPGLGLAPAGASGGTNWADLIAVANQSALQWYATATQKPVQSGAPTSYMRNVFGSDFSGGPTVLGQTTAPVGTLILVGIIVAGAVLILRKR